MRNSRPWYRIHLSTGFVILFTVLFLFILNLRGSHVDAISAYTYGWPMPAYHRWEPPGGGDALLMQKLEKIYHSLGEHVAGYIPNEWHQSVLAYDIILALAIVLTVAVIAERIRRRSKRSAAISPLATGPAILPSKN